MYAYSIIIPAYNAEDTLKPCLDSIFSRKKDDYEVVLIDDGSTDDTLNIANEYKKKRSNFAVYSGENKGSGSSRNDGVNFSSGKYILFCDSDDKYDEAEFNKLLDEAENLLRDRDMLSFSYNRVFPDGSVKTDFKFTEDRSLSFDGKIGNIYLISSDFSREVGNYCIWNKIYKREIIEKYNVLFPERDKLNNENDWSDDLAFNLQYFLAVRKIRTVPISAYLVTDHGEIKKQSEKEARSRVLHMTRALAFAAENVKDEKLKPLINENFYKIFIYHMKRYFYECVRAVGPKETRKEILSSRKKDIILKNIKEALKNYSLLKYRWDEKNSLDYKALLRYLLSGCSLLFKIRNAYIWKVKPAFCEDRRASPTGGT